MVLADGRKCCGRPAITGGQAQRARPWADHNVALLAPYAQAGVPIIGIEPSCILTLRDEYPTLASDKRRAQLLAEHALTFEEFVVRELDAGRFNAPWKFRRDSTEHESINEERMSARTRRCSTATATTRRSSATRARLWR